MHNYTFFTDMKEIEINIYMNYCVNFEILQRILLPKKIKDLEFLSFKKKLLFIYMYNVKMVKYFSILLFQVQAQAQC